MSAQDAELPNIKPVQRSVEETSQHVENDTVSGKKRKRKATPKQLEALKRAREAKRLRKSKPAAQDIEALNKAVIEPDNLMSKIDDDVDGEANDGEVEDVSTDFVQPSHEADTTSIHIDEKRLESFLQEIQEHLQNTVSKVNADIDDKLEKKLLPVHSSVHELSHLLKTSQKNLGSVQTTFKETRLPEPDKQLALRESLYGNKTTTKIPFIGSFSFR